MAKRKRAADQISKRIAEGRGKGRGADYKPALHIQDVPSQGLATRDLGWKTGRVHHFMSKLEWFYFYILEWSLIVTDIREQYPLDLEETMAIAQDLGVCHPSQPGTQNPVTMTTDFLVTVKEGIGTVECARTTKYAKDLSSERVMEKFEIERLYWKRRKVDWGIVTELEIDNDIVKNVEWVHPYRNIKNLAPLASDTIRRVETVLTPQVVESNEPLKDLTNACDDRLGLLPGSSLTIVRHLIACRRWPVDISKPILPGRQITFTAVPAVMIAAKENAA